MEGWWGEGVEDFEGVVGVVFVGVDGGWETVGG